MRSVGGLEAAMQAAVSDAVAIAVTRHLVQHTGNLGRQLIAFHLVGILEGLSPQLVLGQDGHGIARLQRVVMISGHAIALRQADHGQHRSQSQQREFSHGTVLSRLLTHSSGAADFAQIATPSPSLTLTGDERIIAPLQ